MAKIHVFPDQRIPKVIDDIVQIIYDIDPPIHTATALGILDLCKMALVAEQTDKLEE